MRSLRDPRYLLLAMVSSLSIACLVGRRSDDFSCTTADDCAPDRGCLQGFCVVPVCPAGCACQDLLPDRSGYADCTIDCAGSRCRNQTITCPAGMACTVRCDNNDDCARVDCSQATSCEVACSASGTCEDGVICGAGACDVTCSGSNSCDGGVSCGSACRCDVTCDGANACGTPATCPSGVGCDTGPGCDSTLSTCNRCP